MYIYISTLARKNQVCTQEQEDTLTNCMYAAQQAWAIVHQKCAKGEFMCLPWEEISKNNRTGYLDLI